MSLRKPWRPLSKATLREVPDRYGVYELGDDDGTSLGIDAGPLQDELKEAMAYGDGSQVRWQVATSREHAESMLDDHS